MLNRKAGSRVRGLCSFLATLLFTSLLLSVTGQTVHATEIRIVPNLGHSGEMTSAVFSRDGRHVLTAGYDSVAKLWHVDSGSLLRTYTWGSRQFGGAFLSPDDNQILVFGGRGKGAVDLFDRATGRTVQSFETHSNSVNAGHTNYPVSAAFSPDGRLILVGYYDQTAKLLDARSGRLVHWLKGHSGLVETVAFSGDGSQILTGEQDLKSAEALIRLWDVATGKQLRTFKGLGVSVESVAFSPNGAWILGAGGRILYLWDKASGSQIGYFKSPGSYFAHEKAIESVAYSPDGARILTGSTDGTAKLWDTRTSELVQKFTGHKAGVNSVRFSPDGRRILTGSADHTARLWSAETGRLIKEFSGSSQDIVGIDVSPDSGRLAAGKSNGAIEIWDLVLGRKMAALGRDPSTINSIRFGPDGQSIIAGSADKSARLWRLADGKIVRTFKGHLGEVNSASISPDGQKIVTGSTDKTARIWDVSGGRMLHELKGHTEWVTSVVFTPDGQTVATGSLDGTVKLWSSKTGRMLKSFTDNDAGVDIVAISKDSEFLLSGSCLKNTSTLWKMSTGKKTHVFNKEKGFSKTSNLSARLRWFLSLSNSCVADLQGKAPKVLVGSGGNSIYQSEYAARETFVKFDGHQNLVRTARYRPKTAMLVTGSADGTIKIWQSSSGRQIASLVTFGDGSWIVITPEGFFNASNGGAKHLNVVRGLEVLSIDQLYDALYRPDLVREALAGDPKGMVKAAAAKLDLDKIVASGLPPTVEIMTPQNGVTSSDSATFIEVKITGRGGGLGRVEWRVNGVTLGIERERGFSRLPEPRAKRKSVRLGRKLQLAPGKNVIEIVAYNARNLIASDPASITVNRKRPASAIKPRLHVLAVGVNDYYDSRLALHFAVSDAKAIGAALKKAGDDLYETVAVMELLDDAVTASGLEQAFAKMAKAVRPNDVFVFFLAGHGKTVEGHYYFLPQDFRFTNLQSVTRRGIGQDKWQSWLAKIPARKAIMLYDTCESGSLTRARGVAPGWAMAKLNRATGRTVLSASTDDAPALEGYKGHGVFTYSILQALAGSDRNDNKLVEILELADFVESRVPVISHQAFGMRQIPQFDIVGSNFPLVRQTASVLPKGQDGPAISLKPTHVVMKPSELFETAGGKGKVVARLKPGTLVTLVRTEKAWVFVAKGGKPLGFVAKRNLLAAQ